MTIKAVQRAIQHARDVIEEWDEVGLTGWRETQTRYAIIDPIIRALGWDTEDPKECYPEYDLSEGKTRPDYALFGDWNAVDIVAERIAPVIILEAKALRTTLDPFLDKLDEYARAEPKMTEGLAVLTDGAVWRIYEVRGRGGLARKPSVEVSVLEGNRLAAARALHEWLGSREWR